MKRRRGRKGGGRDEEEKREEGGRDEEEKREEGGDEEEGDGGKREDIESNEMCVQMLTTPT